MPLEPTPNLALAWTDSRRTRRSFLGIVAVGSAVILTGCSTGSRRDAERGRERDAERTSVVEIMQQTATSRLINATPPATPTTDQVD